MKKLNKKSRYYYKWINHVPTEEEQYTLTCYHDDIQIVAPDDDWLGGLPVLTLYWFDDNERTEDYSDKISEDSTWHVDTDCILPVHRTDLETKDLKKAKEEAIKILIKSIHEELNSDNEFYHNYCKEILCAVTSVEK